MDVYEKIIAAAVDADFRLALEKAQRLRVKDLADRHLVLPGQLKVFGKHGMRGEIYIFITEHLADKAEKRFGIKREIRYLKTRRAESGDRLPVCMAVFPASDRVCVIEKIRLAAVVRSLQQSDHISGMMIEQRIRTGVLKALNRRVRDKRPAVLRRVSLQSLHPFLPHFMTDKQNARDQNDDEPEDQNQDNSPECRARAAAPTSSLQKQQKAGDEKDEIHFFS